jgi:hypothetical protein
MRRAVVASAIAVLAVLLLGASASPAAKPTFTRIDRRRIGPRRVPHGGMWVPVTFSAQGHVTIRDLELADEGLASVLSVNVATIVSANGNEVTFLDVGADVVRVAPDGTVIVSIIGQLPFPLHRGPEVQPGDRRDDPRAAALARGTGRGGVRGPVRLTLGGTQHRAPPNAGATAFRAAALRQERHSGRCGSGACHGRPAEAAGGADLTRARAPNQGRDRGMRTNSSVGCDGPELFAARGGGLGCPLAHDGEPTRIAV